MGRFSVDLKLTNSEDILLAKNGLLRSDEIRQSTVRGVVDTGATQLVIPAAVAERLGLPETGEMRVRYADRRRETRKVVENIRVELLGSVDISTEPDKSGDKTQKSKITGS